MAADKVTRVDLMVLGERNFPVYSLKLPQTAVADLPELLAAARRMNPSFTYDEIIRAIWRFGTQRLANTLAKGVLPRVEDLPDQIKPIKGR